MILNRHQLSWTAKSAILLISFFMVGIPAHAGDAEPPVHSENPSVVLDGAAADLKEAERESLQLMGERRRIRHEAEYDNPEIAEWRVIAKDAERDVLDLRKRFLAHMRANHPEIRAMERAVRGNFARVRRLREEEELALREQRLAGDGAAVSSADGDEPALRLAALREELADAEREAASARATLEARQQELAEEDEIASAILQELKLSEAEFKESLGRMNALIDGLPAMQEHEAVRVRQMNQMHDLRMQKEGAGVLDE